MMDAVSGFKPLNRLDDGLTSAMPAFEQILTKWQQEAPPGEDRAAAASAFLTAYQMCSGKPGEDVALSLKHRVFSTISSFSSLALEKYFPRISLIDFSHCAALTELPDALLHHVPVINITNCVNLKIASERLPASLKLIGDALNDAGDVVAFIPVGNEDEQWAKYLCYKNLPALAERKQIVSLTDMEDFFKIQHPVKSQVSGRKMKSLGWKLHISVDPADLEKAFDLAAPIIAQSCFNFKVSIPEKRHGDRLYLGGQITIYIQDVEKSVISAEDAEAMIAKVTQVFKDNNIRTGTKPESDLTTKSPYFSMRNAKFESILKRHDPTYLAAEYYGNNANPANYPNPFSCLLNSKIRPFDPAKHFRLFEADIERENLADCFYKTMVACLHEYTEFDTCNEAQKEQFLLQCFLNSPENWPSSLMKKAYANSQEVKLMIKQAIGIIFIYETFGQEQQSQFYNYVNAAQLSSKHRNDNSFKKLIVCLEDCAKKLTDTPGAENKPFFLLDVLKQSAVALTKNKNITELTETIKIGHFYNSQAALACLEEKLSEADFEQFLMGNSDCLTVQLRLAEIHHGEPGAVKKYLYNALASGSANWMEPTFDIVQMMLSTHTVKELQQSSSHGNAIATYTLLCVYARHLISDECKIPRKITTAVPKSRDSAKDCIEKLRANVLYEKALVPFESVMNKRR